MYYPKTVENEELFLQSMITMESKKGGKVYLMPVWLWGMEQRKRIFFQLLRFPWWFRCISPTVDPVRWFVCLLIEVVHTTS